MQVPLRPLDNPTNTSQHTACTRPGSALKKHPRSPRSHFGKNSAAKRPVLPVMAAPAMENSLKEVNHTNPISSLYQNSTNTGQNHLPIIPTEKKKINPDSKSLFSLIFKMPDML